MKRQFLIEEIMLRGVSGEVGGSLEWDPHYGTLVDIDCDSFRFRCDRRDQPVLLDRDQLAQAVTIAQRALNACSDFADDRAPVIASGERYSPASAVAVPDGQGELESTVVLVDYLQSGVLPRHVVAAQKRAQ